MKPDHICYEPALSQIDYIQEWLIDEYNRVGEGFYCNWKIIKKAFESKRIATINSNDGLPIGFAIWFFQTDKIVTIDIISILPNKRRTGCGKRLVWNLLAHFKKSGVVAVEVECISDQSESFARSFGFQEFPQNLERAFSGSGYQQFHKILEPSLSPFIDNSNGSIIELWDDEPHKIKDEPAKWIWTAHVKKGTRELLIPIIHPAYYDWRIKWSYNDNIYYDGKIKRFENKIHFGKFIIIRKLPAVK